MKLLYDACLARPERVTAFERQMRDCLIRTNKARFKINELDAFLSTVPLERSTAMHILLKFGQWKAKNANGDILEGNDVTWRFGVFELFSMKDVEDSGWSICFEVGEKSRMFIDQIDGDAYAKEWVMSIYSEYSKKFPYLGMEEHGLAIREHQVDGRILSLWNGERIVAQASVMRTPMNYTQVVLNRCDAEDY